MLVALAVASSLLSPRGVAPGLAFDVRNAPTAAVFAMMLEGRETYVSRRLPRFVTLRLTEGEMALPAPGPSGTYGDYWPRAGWIGRIERALRVRGLLVGYEREGGNFYVSLEGEPDDAGSDIYRYSIGPRGSDWHTVGANSGDGLAPPPSGEPPSRLRFAGVRWAERPEARRAVLVLRTRGGEEVTRVVREGDPLGVADLKVLDIAPAKIGLRGPRAGAVTLALARGR